MKKVIVLQKKEGETPLEGLERFRRSHIEYADIKMTYAGRLDPMASGVLVALAGEEVKNKEKYLALDKEYEFEILFGFGTDTYDILGKVVSSAKRLPAPKELQKEIKDNLKHFMGKFTQTYPMYSSKTVEGRPLFAYAKSGLEVAAPEREVLVKKLTLVNMKKISSKGLLTNIERRIKKVKGDFRQEAILKVWRKKLVSSKIEYFPIARFKITCGSGTYVRGIADSLGKEIGIPALAFSIKRTKVGKWRG